MDVVLGGYLGWFGVGPKPATRGGVNGSRSKFLPKFKPSAYIPKITQALNVLAKVWNSYGKTKPTQKASNERAKPRSKSEANRENCRTDLPGPV